MILQEVTTEQMKKKEEVKVAKNITWIGKMKQFMIELLDIK